MAKLSPKQLRVFADVASKATLVPADRLLINDTEDSNSTKYATFADLPLERLGTPTYSTVQHLFNLLVGSAIISGSTITDSGGGEIDVAALQAVTKITNTTITTTRYWALGTQTNISLTDNIANFIYADYNGGTPQIFIETTGANFWDRDMAYIGTVYRVGTTLHISNIGDQITNFNNRVIQKSFEVGGSPAQWASGLIANDGSDRYVDITEGVFWLGHSRQPSPEYDTDPGGGADIFSYWYNDGAWQENASQTQVDNVQYNDYGTGLDNITPSQYGLGWLYMDFDAGHLHMVYGNGSFTLPAALDAQPPGDVPPIVATYCFLVGKYIIQRNASTMTVMSPFTTAFSGSFVSSHNGLTDLQGGIAAERYHTTAAQNTGLVGAGDTALHYHSADRARAVHTGQQTRSTISDFAHASTHPRAGADELDGDTLDIDFTPVNYTPTTDPSEVTHVDELTAHLAGIDVATVVRTGYIDGLNVRCQSDIQVTIGTGWCRNDADDGNIQVDALLTADVTSSGANGLDTGSIAANTWYYVWAIWNPSTTTDASLLSLSSTAPTMPSGYTKKRRVGSVRSDGSSDFLHYETASGTGKQRRIKYEEGLFALSGGSATSFTDVSMATGVPPTTRCAWCGVSCYNLVSSSLFIRENGKTPTITWFLFGYVIGYNKDDFYTDSSQIIEYQVESVGTSSDIVILGYVEDL